MFLGHSHTDIDLFISIIMNALLVACISTQQGEPGTPGAVGIRGIVGIPVGVALFQSLVFLHEKTSLYI